MRRLFIDLETFCETPIAAGTFRYAEDAEIMLWAYAIDDGPVKVWDSTASLPGALPNALLTALHDPEVEVIAHNMGFDGTVLRACGYPLQIERTRCTMAMALAHSLPASLDKLGEGLGIPADHKKLADGKKLVQLFCKPRPKKQKLRRATRETHPEEWARFVEYAANDVEAMRACYNVMPKWNCTPRETALWHLDQKINARGIAVDMNLVDAAIANADRLKDKLADEASDMTFGMVSSTTRRDVLLEHLLQAHGVTLPDMRSSTVEELLDGTGWARGIELPPVARMLLENRLGATRTSTTKYAALRRATSSDGRLRGTLQYCGASRTGRWAGRLFQPQNLARVPKYVAKDYEGAVQAIKAGAVDLLYNNPMEVLGSCVRGALVAPWARKLVVADLSNIEGRGLAWAAGETWKLEAFRAFDAGEGEDLYKLAYARAFRVPVETVEDAERSIGKVLELSMGYAGGAGAFATFAAAYAIDLDALADIVVLPKQSEAETLRAWAWAESSDKTYGMSEKVWRTCDGLKRLWRHAHPETVAWWGEMENAARQAIYNPGEVFACRTVSFGATKGWLRMMLPSGRSLCYPGPQVGDDGTISYMGVHQFSRKWCRLNTYSGKLVENAIQGIARDVMAHNMPLIEDAGYEILLTVHDEDITETPDDDRFSAKALAGLMATVPDWAGGFPLAAAGYEAYRYRKG